MVTEKEINAKWWLHRSNEAQALNCELATKADDEQKLLTLQAQELKRIKALNSRLTIHY